MFQLPPRTGSKRWNSPNKTKTDIQNLIMPKLSNICIVRDSPIDPKIVQEGVLSLSCLDYQDPQKQLCPNISALKDFSGVFNLPFKF